MSGRGRGRGRGRPPSGAKLLLMRSAQESGLGDHNLSSLNDITKPALFPDLDWNYQDATTDSSPAAKSRQSSTVYLINKGREIDHRIQTSSHWVRPSQTQVDVVRYQSEKKSHRTLQLPSDHAIIEQMGKNLATDEDYVPQELVPSAKRRKRAPEGDAANEDGTTQKPTLDDLEKQEVLKKREEAGKANVLEEEGGEGSDAAPPDESEEEGEDYVRDYYESEGESDGGGDDAEATF